VGIATIGGNTPASRARQLDRVQPPSWDGAPRATATVLWGGAEREADTP
jgi:hypothetical protein